MAQRPLLARLRELFRRRGVAAASDRTAIAHARFVVVDVETSGLDTHRDRLLSIGAVAVAGGAICLADRIEVVLQQQVASGDDNILLHGITGGQQRSGVPVDEAMRRFSTFVGTDPLVAYHADFDRQFLARAARDALNAEIPWTWIDVAWLAPALLDRVSGHRPLDDWCAAYGIHHVARHNAVSDAVATAELLLILLERAARKGIQTVRQLRDCAEGERRLARLNPLGR